jgi:hypothetical protein
LVKECVNPPKGLSLLPQGRLKSVGRALLRDLNEDLSSIVKEDCELMRIGEFFSRAGVYVDGDDVNRGRRLGGYGEGST